MFEFFRNIRIEPISFWIGFASASLSWWLIVQIRPSMSGLIQHIRKKLKTLRKGLKYNDIQRHLIRTLQYAQSSHVSNQLFALDEILIAPRLLAPPVPANPGQLAPAEDVVTQSIPYMPDWPELGTIYGANTLSITQALSGGSNLAIIGQPGSGKTVTLAALASMAARGELEDPDLKDRVPILIHAVDLVLTIEDYHNYEPIPVIDIIAEAVASQTSNLGQSRQSELFGSIFSAGSALLIVDGLDELFVDGNKCALDFIDQLLREYPDTRAVVATAPKFLDRLSALGFVPLSMALWSHFQQAQFAHIWGSRWSKFINADLESNNSNYISIDPLLLNGWLLNQEIVKSPLSFTLQIWAAYAGDMRGPSNTDALYAYLLRMKVDIHGTLETICHMAAKCVLLMQSTFSKDEAKQWMSEHIPEFSRNGDDDRDGDSVSAIKDFSTNKLLSALIERGLLIPRARGKFSFLHPEFFGYLAGQSLADIDIVELFKQPYSAIKCQTLHHLSTRSDILDQAQLHLTQPQNQDPLMSGQLASARWLRDIPLEAAWRKPILNNLVNILQDDAQNMAYRSRVLTALVLAKDPNLSGLFQHLAKSRQRNVRKLAALGLGTQYNAQSTSFLSNLLQDYPEIANAACLALVSIGTKPSLDAVSNALMQGNEDLQKAAAESFANHPTKGHPNLQEWAELDDLLVQRAVIYGLRRIREPWTLALLEKIHIEDSQWVVKNAAAQAFEEMQHPDPSIPHTLSPLADTPWLISFAAERDMGISPGKPANKLLLRVLSEGTSAEQLAAMMQIRRRSYANIFPIIYQVLYSDNPYLSEAAYITLWTLAASGTKLPQPMKFGFK
ncbi:MAG: HEAT repeat domain-containing protein [Chloroflexi bacterium]|nr:HEAT repeat domain-containing protein [Chloroflexota bacterium]